MTAPENDVYVAVGSNVEPEQHVPAALQVLSALYGGLTCSPAYRSAPVGFHGPDFINCVVHFRTGIAPERLVCNFKSLEHLAGRRKGDGNRSRALDLDLVLYGPAVIRRSGLDIPRPDILRYAFVLRPLAELAPNRPHPETGRTFAWHWAHFDGLQVALEPVTLDGIGSSSSECA